MTFGKTFILIFMIHLNMFSKKEAKEQKLKAGDSFLK